MKNFDEYLSHCLDDYKDGIIKEAALYSLLNGGKRVRPNLLFATLEAYHINREKGFAAACAIEMVHTYSLIHDDLPAMDNDTLRRGNPTCHVKYGEAMAILAGDALLNEAFSKITIATNNNITNLKLAKALAQYSGLRGMIYGQELDILNENNISLTEQDLMNIHKYKTGCLLTLPLVMAAMIADKDNDIETLKIIGEKIGLLFQIQDDVFDVTKTTEELGKNANSDIENKKCTYVSLFGIEKCNEKIQQLYDETMELLDQMMIDKNIIVDYLDYIMNRKN